MTTPIEGAGPPPPTLSEIGEARFFDLSLDLLVVADAHGQMARLNTAWRRILGWTEAELVGRSVLELVHPDDRESAQGELLRLAAGATTPAFTCRTQHRDGSWVWTRWSATLAGVPPFLFAVGKDISDLKEAELEQARLVSHLQRVEDNLRKLLMVDELTGVLSRRGFLMMAEQQLKTDRRLKTTSILLFADLDGLKQVNDTLGHQAGDALIVKATRILSTTVRDVDLVGRLGGDEFAVFLAGCRNGGDVVTQRVRAAAAAESPQRPGTARFSLSVGMIQSAADDPRTLEELIKAADAAMYAAKPHRLRPTPADGT